MKSFYPFLMMGCLYGGNVFAEVEPVAIIPKPNSIEWGEEVVTLDLSSCSYQGFSVDVNPQQEAIHDFVGGLAEGHPAGESELVLTLDAAQLDLLGEEGYLLTVGEEKTEILAAEEAGMYYGLQTLRQLTDSDVEEADQALTSPMVEIVDSPRFHWRGLMLDSGRYFLPVDQIKKMIDLMALHKLNVLHWHLTEDQGWRAEIKQYPLLTEVGSIRAESPQRGNRGEGDGQVHQGFYTQEDMRDIVAYAADRFITVMPEIEVPGHSSAALASYPEFGNTDIQNYDPQVETRWGVKQYTYAPKEETLEFLGNVFDEILEIFPSPVIHIGGDEAPVGQWRQSAFARAFMEEQGFDDTHQIQGWFNEFLAGHMGAENRRIVGWDEILNAPLPDNIIVMSWRGVQGGQRAAEMGYDVVMAPNSHTYMDYAQSGASEPEAIRGYLTLEKLFSFNPLDGISEDKQHHVLGIQGQLWGEYIWDGPKLEYMAFPRACALAEVAWTEQEGNDPNLRLFKARLAPHLERLRALDVNFREMRGGAADSEWTDGGYWIQGE